MTETERHVNETCECIVASGVVRLYRDLYKDLRERLPCGVACRLIAEGLDRTRRTGARARSRQWALVGRKRSNAIAALRRLARWADGTGSGSVLFRDSWWSEG